LERVGNYPAKVTIPVVAAAADLNNDAYAPVVSSVAVADFNSDGRLDIAVGMISPEEVLIFTNDGTGKYLLTSYATGVGSLDSIAADLSHDGKPGLATLNYYTYASPMITVLVQK
jgi:hypothetical protein